MARTKRLTLAKLAVYCKGIADEQERMKKACRRCVHHEPLGFKPQDAIGDRLEQDEDDPEIEEMP